MAVSPKEVRKMRDEARKIPVSTTHVVKRYRDMFSSRHFRFARGSCGGYIFMGAIGLFIFSVYLGFIGIQQHTRLRRHNVPKEIRMHQGYKEMRTYYQLGTKEAFIFGAYLDDRFDTSYIRMFGMQKSTIYLNLKCRFYSGNVVIESAPEKIYAIDPLVPVQDMLYQAYYYGCEVPTNYVIPEDEAIKFSVVVEEDEHTLETNIPVEEVEPPTSPKRDVAICVKGMWGPVDAHRLVEWIEFNLLLGVQHITFYDIDVYGAAPKVFKYYSEQGIVDVVGFQFAEFMMNKIRKDPDPKQTTQEKHWAEQIYLVSINDCLYRNMKDYKYVLMIDTNEILTPTTSENIPEVLSRASRAFPNAVAYTFHTAWHFEDFGAIKYRKVPSFLHTIRFLKRTEVSDSNPKSAFLTDRFVSVNWYGVVMMPPVPNLEGNFRVPWEEYAFIHHYRKECKYSPVKCRDLQTKQETDTFVGEHYYKLKERVEDAINLILPF